VTLLAVGLSAYVGGVIANTGSDNPFNPGQWNWKSPSTYVGIAGGAMKGLNTVGINIPSPTSLVGDFLGHGSSGSVGIELARAGMHGLINGGMNALQGGDFWQSFGVGAISSLAGSAMMEFGMPNHLLLPAMGGVGALTAWGLGGDPLSGFWQGFGIGALNHTGGGLSFDDPIQLDEVVITPNAPKSLQDWRFPYINPHLSNLSTALDYGSSRHGMFNAGNSLKYVNYPLAGMSIYNNALDAIQGKTSWGRSGYETVKTGLSLYLPTAAPVAYYNSVESLMIGGLNYATEAKIRTEMWFNNVLTPGYWGFK